MKRNWAWLYKGYLSTCPQHESATIHLGHKLSWIRKWHHQKHQKIQNKKFVAAAWLVAALTVTFTSDNVQGKL